MAGEKDHIALANRNHDALNVLLSCSSEHPEWVATIAFYKALQIVEACFANRGIGHSNGHQRRLDILRDKKNGFDVLYKPFRALLEASEVARYLSDRFTDGNYGAFSDYMDMAAVKEKLLEKRLANVEMHARRFLSEDSKKEIKQIKSFIDESGEPAE